MTHWQCASFQLFWDLGSEHLEFGMLTSEALSAGLSARWPSASLFRAPSSPFSSTFPHKPRFALFCVGWMFLCLCPSWLADLKLGGGPHARVRCSLPYQRCLLNVVRDSQLGSLATKQVETISCWGWCYVAERFVPQYPEPGTFHFGDVIYWLSRSEQLTQFPMPLGYHL